MSFEILNNKPILSVTYEELASVGAQLRIDHHGHYRILVWNNEEYRILNGHDDPGDYKIGEVYDIIPYNPYAESL